MNIRTGTIEEVSSFGLWSEDNAGDILVAVEGGAVVAFAQHSGTTIYFLESNAKGAGRALVEHILDGADYAAAENVTGVCEGFWKKMGFERDGVNAYRQPVWTWYANA